MVRITVEDHGGPLVFLTKPLLYESKQVALHTKVQRQTAQNTLLLGVVDLLDTIKSPKMLKKKKNDTQVYVQSPSW